MWYRGLCCQATVATNTTLRLASADITFPEVELEGPYQLAGLAITCDTRELFVALHRPGEGVFVISWEDGYSEQPMFVGSGTCCLYGDLVYRNTGREILSWQLGTRLGWKFVMPVASEALVFAGSPDALEEVPSLLVCTGSTAQCIPGPTWTFSTPVVAACITYCEVWVLTADALYRNGTSYSSVLGATSLRIRNGDLLVAKQSEILAIIPTPSTRQ